MRELGLQKTEERNREAKEVVTWEPEKRGEERRLNLAKDNQAKNCTFGEFEVRGSNFNHKVFLC